MTAAKAGIEKEHTDLLNERYDLVSRATADSWLFRRSVG
jgi:hypothetical protein